MALNITFLEAVRYFCMHLAGSLNLTSMHVNNDDDDHHYVHAGQVLGFN